RQAAVRRQVLPDRHPLSRLRRGTAFSVPLGGDRLSGGARHPLAGGVRSARLHRSAGLPHVAGGGVRLRLAEGGVPVAVKPNDNLFNSKLDFIANFLRASRLWAMP